MIPQAFITQWGLAAPWPNQSDIEQDLIVSRLIVEIASDSLLGPELALRGGTCFHKLHLPNPLRYSEDLDYVRGTNSPIGPFFDALRAVAGRVGLDEGRRGARDIAQLNFRCASTDGLRTINIKIETNTRETHPCFPHVAYPYSVNSAWWTGSADVRTYELDELAGTKVRALYQRRKGRDLFDLWLMLTRAQASPIRIVQALTHYMSGRSIPRGPSTQVVTYPQLARNLKEKLANSDFVNDLGQLIAEVPTGYSVVSAADLVMERLGSLLRNAPDTALIQEGRWRQ